MGSLMKAVTKVRLLNTFGLFNHVRSWYYQWESRNRALLNFYAQFIKPGSLCFDIGANIGRKTDIFLRLGAGVVAVEPHPECFQFLRRKYRHNKKVTVIAKALDERQGTKELYLCEANSLSSLSPEWIQAVKLSGRYEEFTWNKEIEIATTTLDGLIRDYGRPDLCKIDVEGFELNVLKGLSQSIPVISFELAPESIHNITACIRYLSSLGAVAFNLSEGENAESFMLEAWLSYQEMTDYLYSFSDQKRFGEVYARFALS